MDIREYIEEAGRSAALGSVHDDHEAAAVLMAEGQVHALQAVAAAINRLADVIEAHQESLPQRFWLRR
jgi:hypothetical protein